MSTGNVFTERGSYEVLYLFSKRLFVRFFFGIKRTLSNSAWKNHQPYSFSFSLRLLRASMAILCQGGVYMNLWRMYLKV